MGALFIYESVILLPDSDFWRTESPRKKEERWVMFECLQSSNLTQNVDWGLPLCPAPPKQGTANQPHNVEMSSQGVMSSKKTSNCTGLRPIEEQ